MKRILLLTCLIVVLPLLVAGQNLDKPLNQDSKTVQELMRLVQHHDDAWVRGDIAMLERMMADDFTLTNRYGKLLSKSENLADIKSGERKWESARSDDVAIRVYGNTAVITGRWTAKGQYKGESRDVEVRYTSTLVKQQGRWQIVADHASEIRQ